MKKFGVILAAILIIVAFAMPAFAFRTLGEVSTDRTGTFAVDGLAPETQTVVQVTKGFYNFDISQLAKYKFWFTKSADDTSTPGKVRVGGFVTGSETYSPTAGETFVRGKNQKVLGFAVYSSAGTNINILGQ